MSNRDEKSCEKLNKKYVKQKITPNSNDMINLENQLKEIQPDFEVDMIPISFIIVNCENIYFAKPSITINEMLGSESLRQRITKECEEVGIDSTLLDAPSITPIINSSRTIQQWIDVNSSKSAYIIYKYKSDLCKSQIEQQNKKKDISQSKSSITIEPIDSMSNLRQINEQQKLQIDELLLSIKKINERIEKQDAKIEKRDAKIAQQDAKTAQQDAKIAQQDDKIAQQDAKIAQQDAKIVQQDSQIVQQNSQIKVLKSNIHSLFIAIKPLTNLNKRILIEKFRLYLVNKYSDLFQNQTGVLVTHETKYRDIYQFMSNFLNDLYQGQGASLITSEEERECVQHVLGNKGSYYQIISDTFVHEATKESIAESVLCTDTTNKHIWINMYQFVFGEEPNLTDIVLDPIPEGDIA